VTGIYLGLALIFVFGFPKIYFGSNYNFNCFHVWSIILNKKDKELDKRFKQLQSDWQKSLTKFMKISDDLNDEYNGEYGGLTPPGMTETMLFGLMWHVVKERIKKYYPKNNLNAELEFVRSMMKRILNEDYPPSLFHENEEGELVPLKEDKKITIN
jgi:hypothetical protein